MENLPLRIWFLGERNNIIFKVLQDSGLDVHPLENNFPKGPGIVVLDEVNSKSSFFLEEISHKGLIRILVILPSYDLLAGDGGWSLLAAGASDVLVWDNLKDPASEILAKLKRWSKIDTLIESHPLSDFIVGRSPSLKSVLRQIVEVAHFTDASVLITGESGTGKELAANLVHTLDPRPNKGDFIVLDCTTIVPELSGSEFFGHERGAFTGAINSRDGAFALANGGTLFLDEIGELPLSLQAQLLRVIQEGTYKRVGGNIWKRTDFRLVCATNRDLKEEIKRGRFRRDLYYRLANWNCTLPPLRERQDDIPLLAEYFLKELYPHNPPEIDGPILDFLINKEYPGNIRDLKKLILRIGYRSAGQGRLTVGSIPEDERPDARIEFKAWRDQNFENSIRRALLQNVSLDEIGKAAKDTAVDLALAASNGSIHLAARKLKVTDRALQIRKASIRQEVTCPENKMN